MMIIIITADTVSRNTETKQVDFVELIRSEEYLAAELTVAVYLPMP